MAARAREEVEAGSPVPRWVKLKRQIRARALARTSGSLGVPLVSPPRAKGTEGGAAGGLLRGEALSLVTGVPAGGV